MRDTPIKELLARRSKEQIEQMAQHIYPMVRRDGHLVRIEMPDLFNVSFIWNPTLLTRVFGITTLQDITTYHGWSYYGLFKPSVAEVLAMIPDELVDSCVAFEIVEHPRTGEDFDKDRDAFDQCYHVATTRLYKLEGR